MELLKTATALAITFGLLAGLILLLRSIANSKAHRLARWQRHTPKRQLESIERLALAPDCVLHLVAINGESILLAVSNKAVVSVPQVYRQVPSGRPLGGAA